MFLVSVRANAVANSKLFCNAIHQRDLVFWFKEVWEIRIHLTLKSLNRMFYLSKGEKRVFCTNFKSHAQL